MQNFEEAFLNMNPVIGDEIYVDMERYQEQSQTDLERIRSGDPFATHSQPHISPDYPPDNDVDVFEGTHLMIDIPLSSLKRKEYPGRRSLRERGRMKGSTRRRSLRITTSPSGQFS
jgi:hypothetical protein